VQDLFEANLTPKISAMRKIHAYNQRRKFNTKNNNTKFLLKCVYHRKMFMLIVVNSEVLLLLVVICNWPISH